MKIPIFKKLNRNIQEERGASSVEFALILPLLLLIIFGIIEFGMAYHSYLAITHAAREGARLASVNRYSEADVIARTDLSGNVTVSANPHGGNTGDPVSVTVTYEHPMITGYLSAMIPGFPSTITMSSTAEMRLEQPSNLP